MKLTRIEKDNLEFFRFLCPFNVLEDDTYTRLGMITDDGKAYSVMAFYIRGTGILRTGCRKWNRAVTGCSGLES